MSTAMTFRMFGMLFLSLSGAAGCGGDSRVAVKGVVTYGDDKVDNGTIVFVPDDDGPGSEQRFKVGTRIKDGVYDVPANIGPVPGKYRVELTWDKKTGRRISNGDADGRDETKQLLPPQYNKASTMTVEIKRGANVHDFLLKK